MAMEYVEASKPILKRNAAMLTGLDLDQDSPGPKLAKVEDSIEDYAKIEDSSELWGDDFEPDSETEDAKENEDKEIDSPKAKIPKSVMKGSKFNFQNCTVNFGALPK